MPNTEYVIIMGRTQNWMKSQLTLNGCRSFPEGILTASYAFGRCGFGQSKLFVLVSMAAKGSNFYSNEEWAASVDLSKVNLATYALREYEMQVPHELFHIWNDEFYRSNSLQGSMPSWFSEGMPQLMGFLSNSIVTGIPAFTYFSQWEPFFGGMNSKNQCIAGIRNLEPYCQYSEGTIASAYLVAKYGGLEIIRKILNQTGNLSFDQKFEKATGVTLNRFYDEVDAYLASIGWKK